MSKIISIIICLSIIVGTVTGCTSLDNTDISVDNQKYDIEKISDKFVKGNTEFAFDIFKQLNKEDEHKSVFISPLSISIALSMTYQGAKGTTKDGMAKGWSK